MPDPTRCWTVTAVAVTEPEAAALLRDYFTELAGRYYGRPATGREVDAAMAEDPSDDLPLFLVTRYGDTPAGCVGLRMPRARIAELTRMFVRPGYRRLGGGGALLAAVEQGARDRGATAARLDTRRDLVEARGLYAKHGYREIPPYSAGPYADHWFEKALTP